MEYVGPTLHNCPLNHSVSAMQCRPLAR